MSFPQLRSKIVNQLTSATALVAYTLAAASGSFDVVGTAATPKAGFVLTANAGSYTETGIAATLNKGFTVAAANGSYSVSGTSANFAVSMPADTTSYAWTGAATTLTYNSLSADLSVNHDWQREYPRAFQRSLFGKRGFNFVNAYNVTANSGTYTLVGTDANFTTTQVGHWINRIDKHKHAWPRPFAPSPWGHFTTVKSLNRLSFATVSYALSANSGSYVTSGNAATLLYAHLVPAQAGQFDWNVFAANLNKGQTIIAGSGSFGITSPEVLFKLNLPADVGIYTWTGSSAVPLIIRSMASNSATYIISGTTASLLYSAAAFPGSYAWSGNIATLRWSGETAGGRGGILLLGAG